jgi:hypothetical protein
VPHIELCDPLEVRVVRLHNEVNKVQDRQLILQYRGVGRQQRQRWWWWWWWWWLEGTVRIRSQGAMLFDWCPHANAPQHAQEIMRRAHPTAPQFVHSLSTTTMGTRLG